MFINFLTLLLIYLYFLSFASSVNYCLEAANYASIDKKTFKYKQEWCAKKPDLGKYKKATVKDIMKLSEKKWDKKYTGNCERSEVLRCCDPNANTKDENTCYYFDNYNGQPQSSDCGQLNQQKCLKTGCKYPFELDGLICKACGGNEGEKKKCKEKKDNYFNGCKKGYEIKNNLCEQCGQSSQKVCKHWYQQIDDEKSTKFTKGCNSQSNYVLEISGDSDNAICEPCGRNGQRKCKSKLPSLTYDGCERIGGGNIPNKFKDCDSKCIVTNYGYSSDEDMPECQKTKGKAKIRRLKYKLLS